MQVLGWAVVITLLAAAQLGSAQEHALLTPGTEELVAVEAGGEDDFSRLEQLVKKGGGNDGRVSTRHYS